MTKTKTETETKTPREPPQTIRVPRDLFNDLRSTLRAVGRDTRRGDRQLHDDTRTTVENTIDSLDNWQDQK